MKLTLLRHGETDGSRRDLYYGAADIPALPESLAALHENAAAYPRAKRYYTSGLLRTEQTLEAIYGPVAHQQLPGLQEMNFGDFEMKSYQELKDTERVNLAEVMSGENGAERVKTYSVPMAEGMAYNYAAKAVDDNVLEVLK